MKDQYDIATSPSSADVILGYHELLTSVADSPTPSHVARLAGDQIVVHKTQFLHLVRGKEGFAQGLDLRSEVGLLASPEAMEGVGARRGVTGGWYLVLPDGLWSAVVPHLSNHPLEMARWSEVGPAAASQC